MYDNDALLIVGYAILAVGYAVGSENLLAIGYTVLFVAHISKRST